jgi:hypothetical protein
MTAAGIATAIWSDTLSRHPMRGRTVPFRHRTFILVQPVATLSKAPAPEYIGLFESRGSI